MGTQVQKINEEYVVTRGKYQLNVIVHINKGTMALVSPIKNDRNIKHHFVFDESYPETVAEMSLLFAAAANVAKEAMQKNSNRLASVDRILREINENDQKETE